MRLLSPLAQCPSVQLSPDPVRNRTARCAQWPDYTTHAPIIVSSVSATSGIHGPIFYMYRPSFFPAAGSAVWFSLSVAVENRCEWYARLVRGLVEPDLLHARPWAHAVRRSCRKHRDGQLRPRTASGFRGPMHRGLFHLDIRAHQLLGATWLGLGQGAPSGSLPWF